MAKQQAAKASARTEPKSKTTTSKAPAAQAKKRTGQKRAAGEGCIIQRPNGLWEGRVRVTDPGDNSKQKRVSVYGKTQGEVLSKLEAMREQRRTSPKSLLAKDSLGAYLARWLEDDIEPNKAPKTAEEYRGVVRLHVLPYLGAERLAGLDGEKLVRWQSALMRAGRSAATRAKAIRVLRCALNRAVRLRLIPFSPMVSVDRPRLVRDERRPLEPEQIAKLVEVCQGHRLGDLIALAVMTGLRKGELFGLQWSAVNLSERVLVVRRSVSEPGGRLIIKEPKSRASRRVVTLGVDAVAALQRRLEKAKEEGMGPEEVPVVFPDSRGGYLRSSNFDKAVWYPLRAAAGIPESVVFHDLRHSAASLLLAAGVSLKTIQARLGHQDFGTTANTYSHLLAGAQAEAVAKVDELMSRVKKRG